MQRFEHGGNIHGRKDIQFDFSVNVHPLGMTEGMKQALIEGIDQDAHYPDPQCSELSQAIALYHGVQTEQVLCGNGASDLILRICAALRPKKVMVCAPTFSEYARSALLFGAELVEYTLQASGQFALDEAFLQALHGEIDLLFLCQPNNPTGRLMAPRLLKQILQRCHERNIRVVLDECFIDFTEGTSMIAELKHCPHLLILRAFTKIHAMAGLRLGYLLCSDGALLEWIASFGPTWSVSSVAQRVGLAALQETERLEQTRALIRSENAFMSTALEKLGFEVIPSDGNFLLVRGPRVAEALLERGILVRDCSNFTGLDDSYMRIGLKTRPENTVLIQVLKEVLHG